MTLQALTMLAIAQCDDPADSNMFLVGFRDFDIDDNEEYPITFIG